MKRKLVDEIKEGFDALADQRQGKRTLRTHYTDEPMQVGRAVRDFLPPPGALAFKAPYRKAAKRR